MLRILRKAMDQIQDLINSLSKTKNAQDPLLSQLNMDNLSRPVPSVLQNDGSQENAGNGPALPAGVNAIPRILDSNSLPKTSGGLNTGTLGPSAADQATLNQMMSTPPSNPQTTTPSNAAGRTPFTSDITPTLIDEYTKKFNVPDPKITEGILKGAKATGTNADLLFQFANAESNYNPTARPTIKDPKTGKVKYASSAQGLYQFLNGTWSDVMDKYGAKQQYGLTGNRNDPYESAVGAAVYLNQIKKTLSKADPSADGNFSFGQYYLGHFAGPGGASKVLQAINNGKGNLPASAVFDASQIAKNPTIFYTGSGKNKQMRTIQNVVDHLDGKVAMKQDDNTNQGEA